MAARHRARVGYRHFQSDPAGPQPRGISLYEPRQHAPESGIEGYFRERLSKLDFTPHLDYLTVAGLSPLDRKLLVERQLISRELSGAEGPRGLAVSAPETMSIMVNEEDHL